MVLTSTSQMPPNSQYINIKVESEVLNLSSTNTKINSMDRGESLVSATTDVAATKAAKSPTKEESPEGGEQQVDGGDDGFGDFLKIFTSADELAKADPSEGAAEKAQDPAEEQAAAENEGLAVGETSKESPENENEPTKERRRSSLLKAELARNSLLDSVKTVDSWGGKEGSLPPLTDAAKRNTMPEFNTTSNLLLDSNKKESDLSDLDDSDKSDPQDPAANNRSKSWSAPRGNNEATADLKDDDQVANYVNFNKLLQPGSSKYYYSQANHSNRQLLEKVKSKKKLQRGVSLDESGHSRASMLSERSRHSSYRGPAPLLRDGSVVKGVIKKKQSCEFSVGLLSVESMPEEPEGGEAPKASGLKRCSFSSVDIREHERIAGDNPCVSSGVPLSIGWGYYQHDPISLDDYETYKGPSRDKIEMMVPAGVRRQMLRDEFGVSIAEMNAAMREVNLTKRQRRHTVATEHMEGWSEVLQSAKRKFKRFVKGTTTVKEEDKLWEQAHKSAMSEYLKQHGSGSLGKNPESAGVGSINKGPKIVPQEGSGQGSAKAGTAPFLEISFQQGEGEGAPTF